MNEFKCRECTKQKKLIEKKYLDIFPHDISLIVTSYTFNFGINYSTKRDYENETITYDMECVLCNNKFTHEAPIYPDFEIEDTEKWLKVVNANHLRDERYHECYNEGDDEFECKKCKSNRGRYKYGADINMCYSHEPAETLYLICMDCGEFNGQIYC